MKNLLVKTCRKQSNRRGKNTCAAAALEEQVFSKHQVQRKTAMSSQSRHSVMKQYKVQRKGNEVTIEAY